jgi:hypothetical protein
MCNFGLPSYNVTDNALSRKVDVFNELNGNLDPWGKGKSFEQPSDSAVTSHFCDTKGPLVMLFLATRLKSTKFFFWLARGTTVLRFKLMHTRQVALLPEPTRATSSSIFALIILEMGFCFLPGQFGTQSYFMLLHVAGMTGVPHRVFFC